ncbi:MAG: response regulator [Candidatus Nitrosocosmicus sp.]|nr:response regulator [Candidatus Nitrosocosmicus sp.]
MNFVECEFQREQPFEESGEKPYKEHTETVMFKEKISNSTADVADTNLSDYYKRKSNKSEDSTPTNSSTKEFEPSHILIAEPEPDILTLLKTFLETLGVTSATVADGEVALEFFLEKENKGRPYDVVVLDTHLKGLNGLDLAKMIHDISPTQRIIMVTTTPKEYLPKYVLRSAMIEEGDILTMPFRLSDFISKLKQKE